MRYRLTEADRRLSCSSLAFSRRIADDFRGSLRQRAVLENTLDEPQLTDFAIRYAAAWSSQTPDSVASFYAGNGSLTVNDGEPSVGRAAITATAKGFMTAFPDMVVKMDRVRREGGHAVFHWTWTGTNSGPGGTGRSVRISGYEEWMLGADGLIVESEGHFDEAEYQRQLMSSAPPVP